MRRNHLNPCTFRGFRHSAGKEGMVGQHINMKPKAIALEGNEVMDGMVNWEGSQVGDSERFSQEKSSHNGIKATESFDIYLKRKKIRTEAKKLAREKLSNST